MLFSCGNTFKCLDMMWSRKRLHCLFLALFLWESANGLGVWQKRSANYWRSGDGSKGSRDQALSRVQQNFSSSASGVQSAAYDAGSVQPLSTSGKRGPATNFLGFLKQYTISSDQNVPTQYSPFPQSQIGYTAQSSVSSGKKPSPGFQSQLLSDPVFPSQGSASQSLESQQSSLQIASPGPVVSSPPLQFVVPGTQTQSSSPGTSTSTFATNPQQATYGFKSATGTLYGPTSDVNPSQSADAPNQPAVVVIDSYTAGPAQWYRVDPFGHTGSQALGSQGSQAASSSSLSTSLTQSTSGSIGFGFQSQSAPASTGFQSQLVSSPVSSVQGSASQSLASQQSSLQLGSSSQGASSLPLSFTAGYVPGSQAQPSSSATSSLSSASAPSSQQASYGSQSAAGTQLRQPSIWYFPSQGQSAQITFQSQTAPYKLVSPSQGSAPVSIASKQGGLQLTSPSLSLTTSFVPVTQAQPSSPAASSLSSAGATSSQQASYGSQSAAGLQYGQPSSWYFPSQGQSAQTAFQSQASPYKPVSPSQGFFSQSLASQQSSLQLGSSSQGTSSQPLSFTASHAPGTQSQPSSPASSSLSSASPTTSQQTSYGSQSAAGTLYGQPSSLYFPSQSQNVQVPTQSADAPYKSPLGAYTAAPAQWYRFDPFGPTRQVNKPLSASQALGSQGSQAPSSSSTTTSQTQSTTGSVGFGFQTQSAPSSTVGLTQSAAQLPSFQAPSGFSSTFFSASSPSASVSQPSQGSQSSVTWTPPGVSTSFDQSSSSFGQDIPVALTQQYSRDAYQVVGASSNLPSKVPSTSQTSGKYGSTFQSGATRVGSFDQYSPASSTYLSAQGTPISFGLAQDYGIQSFSASGLPQTAVSTSLNQAISKAQGGSSVYGDSLSFSSFKTSDSTSYSFAPDLNNPVFKPPTRRGQDSSVKQ